MDWIFYFFEKKCSKHGFAASNGQNAKNGRWENYEKPGGKTKKPNGKTPP